MTSEVTYGLMLCFFQVVFIDWLIDVPQTKHKGELARLMDYPIILSFRLPVSRFQRSYFRADFSFTSTVSSEIFL